MLIDYLTLNYIFAYSWIAMWLSHQLFIHACSEANFRPNIFLQIFLWFLAFQCEASKRTWLAVRTQAALLIANLAVDRPDELVTRPDAILTGIFRRFLSQPTTPLHFYWFIMSCCVFFLRISPEILAFSAHLFSFHDILCVFLCSFKFLCFLEYWNICLLEYFLEILCMKILFCLCVGLIFIYMCHLDCYICFCNFWGIQLTTVIILYFFGTKMI